MDTEEFLRYGRQMMVPEIGLESQLRIKSSKVLVIGAGGLGCPAIAYLAGAGIGTLGIVDPDVVELSNLSRQVIHSEIGKYKAESAGDFVRKLNPHVQLRLWSESITAENALSIINDFDVILDCTDGPLSRYLINDACVLSDKPLVAASALQSEGQLAVYHYGEDCPCYRCIFPKPPPVQYIGSCAGNGIVGVVVGIMGIQQAAEAIKIISGVPISPVLKLHSMFDSPSWREIKLRGKQQSCPSCGINPSISNLMEVDYRGLCGVEISVDNEFRLNSAEFSAKEGVVLDVRSETQFQIAHLPESKNFPISRLRVVTDKKAFLDRAELGGYETIKIVCHHGIDSQVAVGRLKSWGLNAYDLKGGLDSWAAFDPTFPRY